MDPIDLDLDAPLDLHACRALWCAVLRQALADLAIDPEITTGPQAVLRSDAHVLFRDKRRLDEVCEMAGIDGDRIHELYLDGQLLLLAQELKDKRGVPNLALTESAKQDNDQ